MPQVKQHLLRSKLDRLNELKEYPAGRVVKDPALLIKMLRLYSELFLNSRPCSTCESKHSAYYKRLVREGEDQILKQNMMATQSCKLKKGKLLFYRGNHFNGETITDKIALALLKENPKNESNFEIYPDKYNPKSDGSKIIEAKKGLAAANIVLKGHLKVLRNAEKKVKSEDKDVVALQEEFSKASEAYEKADDDQKKKLEEEAKKLAKKLTALEVDPAKLAKDVAAAKEKVEEAELEVEKYESMLSKRDK